MPCTAITTGLVSWLPVDLPRVDAALRHDVEAVRADARADVGEVEAAGEVVAVRVDEADPQLGVALELAVGEGQLLQQPQVGGVALVRPVEADEQDVPVAVDE